MSDSLMDGIEFNEKRKTVDADWSKAKRVVVGSIASVLALCAVGAGIYFAWDNRPIKLPRDADEAIAVINSGRLERLSEDRQRQYFAEASRLMQDIPDEERREFFRDEENRDAMRQVMMEQMDNSMREIARGNLTLEDWRSQMMERFANRGPRRERGENGERPERPEGEQRPEGDRPSQAERRQAMTNRVQGAFQNGDGQRMGLMMAFRQKMGGWGGRPGGGGGGGGNRNGGN